MPEPTGESVESTKAPSVKRKCWHCAVGFHHMCVATHGKFCCCAMQTQRLRDYPGSEVEQDDACYFVGGGVEVTDEQ